MFGIHDMRIADVAAPTKLTVCLSSAAFVQTHEHTRGGHALAGQGGRSHSVVHSADPLSSTRVHARVQRVTQP